MLRNNEEAKTIKIRIKTPMLSIRNGMIAETHSVFQQGKTNENVTYGIKSMANNNACIVSPFSILGWMRNGITECLINDYSISPCHAFDLTNVSSKVEYQEYAKQDITYGYHKKRIDKGNHKEKPACEAIKGKKCIVAEMFGGFTGNNRVFSIMPIKVSPVDAQYIRGVRNITGKGNYRSLAVSPRSAVDGTPYQTHDVDIIANLDAILYIKMYEPKSSESDRIDVYTAMIMKGIEYLAKHKDEFKHQLGGNRTFGCGFIEPTFLPLDLTRDETVTYHTALIKMEDDADSVSNITKSIKEKIAAWDDIKLDYDKLLDEELKVQKEYFGFDKEMTDTKWWLNI